MTKRASRLAVVLVVAAAGVAVTGWEAGAQRRRAAPARAASPTFSHATPAHRRSCDSCHAFPSPNWKEARAGAEAFPDVTEFPRHASCLECHRKQFFASERPAPKICSVCHVAVTPRETSRHAFPNPVERFRRSPRARDFVSAFRVTFPHAKHLEVLGRAGPNASSPFVRATFRSQDVNAMCASCHQTYAPQNESGGEFATPPPKDLDGFWLKKSTFKTSPEGHAKCFECHSLDSGLSPAPSDCAACHVLVEGAGATDFDPATATRMGVDDPFTLKVWRRRDASATFPHDGGLHTEVGCTSCHDVAAMDAARGKARVRIQSCGGDMGCHVTATPDEGGALTFEVDRRRADPGFSCAKCHVAYAKRPVPQGHVEAVAKAKAD